MNKLIILPALLSISLTASSQINTNNRNKPLDTVPKPVTQLKLPATRPLSGNVGFFARSKYDDFVYQVNYIEWNKAGFSEEVYDAAENFKNSVFTAPEDGFYHFDGMIEILSDRENGYTILSLDITQKDGSGLQSPPPIRRGTISAADYLIINQLSVSFYLKKGSKAELKYSVAGLTKASLKNGYFSGYKIF